MSWNWLLKKKRRKSDIILVGCFLITANSTGKQHLLAYLCKKYRKTRTRGNSGGRIDHLGLASKELLVKFE